MKDINYPLRKAYVTALTGIVYGGNNIKVFYGEAPDNITDKQYIVFAGINSSGSGTKTTPGTATSISVTIYTYDDGYNNGAAADFIAGYVLQRIYPDRQTHLDLTADGITCITTKLQSDQVQDYGVQSGRKYVDRILVFNHDLSI